MRGLILFLSLVCGGCAVNPDRSPPLDSPYLVVLGTAQDGGFPQIGSDHPRARAARADPAKRRLISSLLIADPRSGKRWLIDATPDIREQVDRARGHPRSRQKLHARARRPPLFEGILLTHAHMGHYTGLVHLGREAYGARNMPVHASAEMVRYLQSNGPWSLLVQLENIRLIPLHPDRSVPLAADIEVKPMLVPHRGEFTDTLAFEIRGPERSVLYIPDIDKWERWERRIEDAIQRVDVALLDGTFFANGEIPGRDMSDIPHPFIEESMARFSSLPAEEKGKIWFTHLNHTNPATEAGGTAQRRIESRGFRVAREAQIIRL